MEPVRTKQQLTTAAWTNQSTNVVDTAVCCTNTNSSSMQKLTRSASFSYLKRTTLTAAVAFMLMILFAPSDAMAQCGWPGSYLSYVNGNGRPPCGSDASTYIGPRQFQYHYVYNGSSYTLNTCGNDPGWDTQLSVYNNSTGAGLYYNDDACGLRSSITYTANFTGWTRIIVERYNCQGFGSSSSLGSAILRVRENPPATPGTPSGAGTYCGSTTLSRTGSGPSSGITWYWQTSASGTSTSLGSGSTLNVTSSGTYYLRARSAYGCWGSASGGASVTIQNVAGTAGTYGNGYWYVSCYNGSNFNSYYGYYTQNGYSWTSTSRWGSSSTPSSANSSGGNAYQGCNIPADNHSTISRRSNFACGYYRIDIPNHDDAVYLYVNGTQVYSHTGCCDSHTGVWYGSLNSGSTVGIRHSEGGGGSHVGINVVNITSTLSGGSITGGGTICVGGNLGSFGNSASASGGSNGLTYEWQLSTNNSTWAGIGSTNSTTYNPPALSQTTYYRRRVTDGCGNVAYSNTRTITVVADPSISSSGGGTVCVGGNRTLSSSASGGTGTCGYQWQSSPNNSTWSNISGATGSTYNTGSLSATTYYRVYRSCSGSGCGTAYSNVQTVTVVADPSISLSGGGTVCTGGSVTFSSSASGGTGSCGYQWQSSPNNSTWSNISGATGSSYTASSLTSTTYYRVVRTCSGSGCNTATSNVGTATVVADPSVSTSGGGTICVGGTRVLSAAASGGTGSCGYQWQSSSNNSTWSNLSGATGSTYTVTGASPATTYYRVYRTCSGSGCGTAYSNSQTVTVVADPSISASGSATVCTGGAATLSSSTSGGTGSCGYQWQSSPNNSTWSNISGATSSTYSASGLTSTTYYRVVRNCTGTGCNTATSNVLTVTVVPDPSISASGSTTVCTGGAATLSSSTSGGTGSCSFQWQSSPNNSTWSNISGATASTYSATGLTSTTYYRVRRSCNGSGCNDPYSNVVTVTVVADPAISISGGSEICKFANTTLTASTSGGTGSCSIQWQSSANGSTGWTNVGTGASFNTGSLSTTTYYRAVRTCSGSGCNTATSNVEQVLIDVTPPVAACKTISIDLSASGTATINASDLDNGSYDNCSSVTFAASKTSFSCADVGSNSVTLTVTDNNGNSATCTGTVIVNDVTAPTASCKNISVDLDSTGAAYITAADVNDNSYDACGIASMSVSPSAFNCSATGTNTVTLTVTDNNGNVSTCTATVTVNDVLIPGVAPNVSCVGLINASLGNNGVATITPAMLDNGSYDNCGLTLTVSPNTFDCSQVGLHSVTLTGTDPAGNTATCVSKVNIVDVTPPTMACKTITVQLDATGNATITPADVDNGSDDNCAIASLSLDVSSFDCSNVGANTVTLTAVDVNGNSASCTATVIVEDNVAPTASCQSITVQLDASGNASITTADIDAGSDDACGIASLSLDKTSFTCSEVGANTVTLTVTDNNGNVSTCTATVTVEDNVAPTASCQSLTIQLDATGSASITTADIDAGSDDACGIASLALSQTAFDCSHVGANTVTLTVTDNNGNVSTCTATVTVEDNVAPVASCQSITVQLDASGNASITTADIDAGSDDACGIASLSLDKTSFDCSEVGPNTVTLTVTDNNGNVSTCTATVTVEDNVAPVASCQSVTVQLDASGNGSITTADIDAGSDDACGIASLALDQTAFDCSHVGANTVTLTVTDNNGNVSTCTATVTVEDNVAPLITCPADITVNNDAGVCGALVTYVAPTGTDACSPSTSQTDATGLTSGSVFPVGTTTLTYTVVDASGNSATCSFNVTVIDNEQPAITCPANIYITADSNDCDPQVFWTAPTPTDNCQVASLTSNFNPGDEFYLGTHTVTYDVVDIHGNTNTCSFDIVVSPKPQTLTLTSPTFACGYNVSCNGESDGSILSYVAGGCLPYTYAWSNGATTADVSGLTAGTYSVTVTTADGQTATESFTITEPDLLVGTATPTVYAGGTNISCNGFNDGAINVDVAGGCPPYTYTWNGVGGFSATTQDVSGLYAGTYKVTIRDANNCSRVLTLSLTEASQLVVDSVTSPTFAGGYNVACNGGNSGNIDLSVSGAIPPYTYTWSNGATTEDLSNVTAGTYDVTVADVNGCTVSTSITLTEPPVLTFDACPGQIVPYGYYPLNVAQITTFSGGGVPPYTYQWSTGETTSEITVAPTATTSYSVTITDANGCQQVATHLLSVKDIRCGSKLDDVAMCDDKGKDKCVKVNDVARRIADGWTLGSCSAPVVMNPGTCGTPVIPGCACEIAIATVVVQYNGPSGVDIEVYGDQSHHDLVATFTNVQNGDLLTISAASLSNARFDKGVWFTTGSGYTKLPLECKDVAVGDVAGDFTLTEYTDVMSNTCNGDVEDCECDDNIAILQMVYRGTSGNTIRVYEDRQLTKLIVEFPNVQQGDTLTVNGTLVQPAGKLSNLTYFETVGSTDPVVTINTDCKAGGTVGRIYGDFFVTGYIDKKDNTCNMPTPCPCRGGISHLGMVYTGAANGTVYAFVDASMTDTLGVYTNLQPGDTIIVSATAANLIKLGNETFLVDANSGDVYTIPTLCNTYIEGQFFGIASVYGYVDQIGTRCHMEDPSECDCEGGLAEFTVEYDRYDSSTISNATIYAFTSSTHADTLAVFTGVNPGDVLTVSAAGMPGDVFNNFTYLKIAGSTGPDIKIPTGCQYPIVGDFIREMYVLSFTDSVGNLCEDECGAGKTMLCHTPSNGNMPHTHCVKNDDVNSKLASSEWSLGPCPILKTGANDIAAGIEEVKLTAYPNPFNNIATFRFTIPTDSRVTLTIYNSTGQRVTELFDREVDGGKEYTVEFDASEVAYGVYYYHMTTEGGKSYNGKLIRIDR